jgi:hypothetical protein
LRVGCEELFLPCNTPAGGNGNDFAVMEHAQIVG